MNEPSMIQVSEDERLLSLVDGKESHDLTETMLTTIDNPFNPFKDFDSWYRFDTEKGYNTCNYLAKISKETDDMSEREQNRARNEAIDEILHYNLLGIYRRIKRDDIPNPKPIDLES